MTKPLPVHGADISHHQGTVDLAKARAAGLQWIYHKATQGKGYVDDRYVERRDIARKLGLPFGAYHFAETTSTPEAQAAHFLKVAGIHPGDMRPMLDLENTTGSSFSGMNLAARTAWVGRFVTVIKKATGVEPFIYTPFDLTSAFNCPLWVARYNPDNAEPRTPKPWKTYTIRQFTNGVVGVPNSFPGLGRVDLNTWNGDPKQLLATFQIGSTTAPVTPRPTTGGNPVSSTDQLTKIFKSYVGFREGKSGATWNNDNIFAKRAGFANFQAWCATFLVAGFKEAGLGNLITTPSPGVDQLSVGFKRAGRWSEYPAVGALMFRGVPSDLNHVGYVYAYDDTYAYTIEGNTNTTGSPQGNGVYQLKRTRRDARLVGYGYPDYPEGIDSADPGFARVGNPTPAPKPPAPVLDLLDAANYPPAGPAVGPHITWLGERLVDHGYSSHYQEGPGPEWGEADRANVEDFQKAQGWTGADADGYPGPETLRRLMAPATTPEPVEPPPTPVPGKATTAVLRVSTANIQNFPNMSDAQVRSDVAETIALSDLVLWQEIGQAQDHTAIKATAGSDWHTTDVDVETPLSARLAVLQPVGGPVVTRISASLGAGSKSPARDMVEQRYTWTIPTDLPDVWAISIHYIQQAWGSKDVPKKPQRKVLWNTGHDIHRAHAQAAVDAGFIVIGGGDWNRAVKDIPLFNKTNFRWVIAGGGLDHVYTMLPPGIGQDFGPTVTKGLNSDHDLRTVRLTLTR